MTELAMLWLGAAIGFFAASLFHANGDARTARYYPVLPVAPDDPTLIRHPNHERALRAVNAERN